jgi:hypothetical protein
MTHDKVMDLEELMAQEQHLEYVQTQSYVDEEEVQRLTNRVTVLRSRIAETVE